MADTLRSIQNTFTALDNVTLTSAFSGNISGVIPIGGVDQISLYTRFTPGTNSDNIDIQVEFSDDGDSWYIEQAVSTSGGTTTAVDNLYTRDGATASTAYRFRITFPAADKYMRLSTRYVGTGAGTATVIVGTSGI